MAFSKRLYIYLVFAVFSTGAVSVQAQDSAIGYWESHLCYNSAVGLATDGNTLFTIGTQSFFTFTPVNAGVVPVPYSKVDGMSDMGMQCIGYDAATSTAILIYTDGNIDLLKDNTFYNIPDFKIKSVSGAKAVYQVYTENGFAYLSTSLGVMVIDLTNRIFKQTYQFINLSTLNNEIIPVKSFLGSGKYFYAATSAGLYRADKNSNQLQNFQVWQKTDSTHEVSFTANFKNSLFFANDDSVFTLDADTLRLVYSSVFPSVIRHIDAGNTGLFVSEYSDTTFLGSVKTLGQNGALIDSFKWPGKPEQVVQRLDNSIWVADYFGGLEKHVSSRMDRYIPPGPIDPVCFDIYAHNKDLWTAHGGYDNEYHIRNSHSGIESFINGKWSSPASKAPVLNDLLDFVSILRDESNGTVYAGSYQDGLFTLNANGSYNVLKQNSIFEPSSSYSYNNQRQIVGLALDNSDNLWVTTFGSQHVLFAKNAADSSWHKFNVPGASNGGPVVVDENNQVWFACFLNSGQGGGVAVYDAAGTLNDPSDDHTYHLTKGTGTGNLPSNTVLCIARDRNSNIWVGTDNGIAIISNCSSPYRQNPPCDAEIPIVQYDKYAGYLFAGSAIRTIAVDGANRKWVGTDDGVWLLSADASKIVYRFTADNSPLPSNHIQKIAVDDVTGDVYFGTEMGLICYRGTATGGGTSNDNVLVYPNPVKNGYSGSIAIKGLVANADVRITDIKGQLVYRTTAYGGQAVWNGLDYTGRRPQSGIYLIFASSSDGSQTYSGKIVFIQ